jgi:hypothetical protein
LISFYFYCSPNGQPQSSKHSFAAMGMQFTSQAPPSSAQQKESSLHTQDSQASTSQPGSVRAIQQSVSAGFRVAVGGGVTVGVRVGPAMVGVLLGGGTGVGVATSGGAGVLVSMRVMTPSLPHAVMSKPMTAHTRVDSSAHRLVGMNKLIIPYLTRASRSHSNYPLHRARLECQKER